MKLGPTAQQHLAAPDRLVRAIPGAVPREPQHGPDQPMLGHAGRRVGVVMLHAEQRHVPLRSEPLGILRRGVIGVQVAGDRVRRGPKERDQIVGRPTETPPRSPRCPDRQRGALRTTYRDACPTARRPTGSATGSSRARPAPARSDCRDPGPTVRSATGRILGPGEALACQSIRSERSNRQPGE